MNKAISVIVPVYNVEKYLRECLDSIVNQTFQDIEIIVVNDGSPDNSQLIIDEYAAKYPHLIRAFIKENGGLSDARNYGVEKAEGEYIAFVDSDDYIDHRMFEQLISCARKNDSDVAACMVMAVYCDGRFRCMGSKPKSKTGCSISESPEQLMFLKSYAGNKIYRRDLLIKTGFSFPKQSFEDSAVIYNLLYYANRVDYVPLPLYYYRKEREGSITANINENFFDIFKSCDNILSLYGNLPDYKTKYEPTISKVIFKHITLRFKLLIGAKNKKLARRYADKAFSYMNEHIPGWENNIYYKYDGSKKSKIGYYSYVKRSKFLLKLFISLPVVSFDLLRSLRKKGKSLLKKFSIKKSQTDDKSVKAAALKAVGYELIQQASEVAESVGVKLFADFGTLLGFIREGGFMDHDLDLDMGVILGDSTYEIFHEALVKSGFTLWRQYIVDCRVAEESYYFIKNGSKIKCDFNYYDMNSERSRTWLFYRKPGVRYGKNTRNVVEMNYSPINEIETRHFGGFNVPVPKEPEKLLAEKYGEGWTRKDTGWIYWKSPAATPIDDIGYFFTEG